MRDKVVRELSDRFKVKPEEPPSELLDYKPNSEPLKSNWKPSKQNSLLSEAPASQAGQWGTTKFGCRDGDVDPESRRQQQNDYCKKL